jgi:hypothetical protein
MTTIFDAMPVKVLEELERIEIAISDKERLAFVLQADAQDLRIRHEGIISSWKAQAKQDGLENLVAERRRQDAIAWILDPLPSRISASEY